jgi:hypothetical protein
MKMSNNKLDNIIKILENISLSAADRSSMRRELAQHINDSQPVRSPWVSILSPLQSLGRSAMVTAVMFLAIGGISLAAEQALPGDLLYAFKLNVNESFMSITALSPTADAVNESRLASRRIAELEALAFNGDLDEVISIHLTTAILNHTALAREEIAKISASGEQGDAASLETELLSSLQTHSDILANLVDQYGQKTTAAAQASDRLRKVAENESNGVTAISSASGPSIDQEYRAGLEGRHEQLSSVQTKRLLERTADRLAFARGQFAGEIGDIQSEKIKASVEALLSYSVETIDQAINFINADKYSAADPLLREALNYAHRATIVMDVRRALESSSGITIDELLNNPIFLPSVGTSTATQIGGADVVPDDRGGNGGIMTADSHATSSEDSGYKEGGEATTSPSLIPAVQGTSTAATSSVKASSSSEEQNFTRQQNINTQTDRRIDEVLERVKETLDSHAPQGFLPARQSHEDRK